MCFLIISLSTALGDRLPKTASLFASSAAMSACYMAWFCTRLSNRSKESCVVSVTYIVFEKLSLLHCIASMLCSILATLGQA